MELPKNITQVGEWDQKCKIYVEDYVISYIKQLNHLARSKEMAVALYGTRKEEGDKSYLFLYGAGKLELLQKESRHLSQAQKQEIERIRRKYFAEYSFLGYRLLNGEMVEGFHVCEQDICRYIEGYAQFYEKNDGMLAYMLEIRNEEPAPEVVDQEKYEEVKHRQEERKRASEAETENRQGRREAVLHKFRPARETPLSGTQHFHKMQVTALAAFAGLCVAGFALMGNTGTWDGLTDMLKEAVAGLSEQKLPDAAQVMANTVRADTLVAEDKLAQALQKENSDVQEQAEQAEENNPSQALPLEESAQPETGDKSQTDGEQVPEDGSLSGAEAEMPGNSETEPEAEPKPEEAQVPDPVSYTIKKGDTLIAISIRNYGNDGRVQDICRLNEISDPDDIKIGQKILLP